MEFGTKPLGTVAPATRISAPSTVSRHASSPALRRVGADLDTPLKAVRVHAAGTPFRYILASNITKRIRAALLLHLDPAYTVADVSVRSTRAGGAMALLCAGIDSNRTRLIGRWRSDEVYRYLHVHAQPVMTGLAAAMLRGDSFHLSPG